ncbi:MAG: adenylate/guanylate cyclase domain-containing protein [Acidimicrobiales bacterium]
MPEIPETQYAETAVGRIAYQMIGNGPVDVLVVHSLFFPIDLMWDEPRLARFLDGLSRFSRHIWFDPRGRGASDGLPPHQDSLAETVVEDMVALLDALELDRVAVLGLPGNVLPLLAASHPDRITAIITYNDALKSSPTDDNPGRLSENDISRLLDFHRRTWGTGKGVRGIAPSAADDPGFRRWLARSQRLSCPVDEALDRMRAYLSFDQRDVFGSVNVPTLVMARPPSMVAPHAARSLAAVIAGAKYLELDGDDFLFFLGDTGQMLDAIEEFLTGELPQHEADRVLATVMFTDIVGSTDHLARVGDRNWKATLTAHDDLVAREIERQRGRHINTTGDGVLATFDGPGRAVRCAQAITEAVRSLGIEVRAGVHTGEIELRGDDVGGIGVHIAARVASLAGPSEVLVSRTVTDLVAGSGIEFEDRGEQELKGVPGRWRVYSVVG